MRIATNDSAANDGGARQIAQILIHYQ